MSDYPTAITTVNHVERQRLDRPQTHFFAR
jgi:hypothetical protein